jgi:hypothetical protein
MVLGFLAGKLAARGGISKGFLVKSLGVVVVLNIAYRTMALPNAGNPNMVERPLPRKKPQGGIEQTKSDSRVE